MTVGQLRAALDGRAAGSPLVVYSYGTEREVVDVDVMASLEKTILVLRTREGRS